jgi:hypothetical protein
LWAAEVVALDQITIPPPEAVDYGLVLHISARPRAERIISR